MGNGNEKIFWIKDHGEVLAVCDKDLLGKTIGSVVINENFYKGELVDAEKLTDKLKNAKNINLFGKNCIDEVIKLKMAENESCIMIGGVPHLQVVFL